MGAFGKAMDYFGLHEPNDSDYENEEKETAVESEVIDFSTYQDDSPVKENLLSSTPKTVISSIANICPANYNEAQQIGESFREGVPVIMNLEAMTDGEARRMVDFAAGLVFGLEGQIERVTNRVFLLTPQSVKTKSAASKREFFNQS